ncbi:hypothetical protein [Flagellimonas algicola]|uniref:Uncharacterized protein n=1 Tax=Flagellimonas algicola TaxID=2583815 RepID=A0ABY2WHP3_9FLAO|nr:hypothetical protein [Allomuricauda algicola]TMU54369.1 hypothetical protein FGG15_09075 [Allomuricauda algicola]
MTPISILEEIQNFWESDSHSTLELTFETLEINLFNHGNPFDLHIRREAELILEKVNDSTLLQMDVVDNLVFPFLVAFDPIEALAGKTTTMQKLPRPLNHGSLCIRPHSLELEFTIEPPEKQRELRVRHVYNGKSGAVWFLNKT